MQRCNRVRADRGCSTIALTMGGHLFPRFTRKSVPIWKPRSEASFVSLHVDAMVPPYMTVVSEAAEIRRGLRTGSLRNILGYATAQKYAADCRPVQYQFQPRERNTRDQATEYRLFSGGLLYYRGKWAGVAPYHPRPSGVVIGLACTHHVSCRMRRYKLYKLSPSEYQPGHCGSGRHPPPQTRTSAMALFCQT
jgi:hypothetical protein